MNENKETLFQQIIKAPKGRIMTITYRSRVKLAKKDADKELYKISTFQGMLGDYYNRKAVKEAHENGSMAYGKGYAEEVVEDVIYVKDGQIYVRFLPIESKTKKAVYILNGEETPIEVLETMFAPSYLHHNGNRPANQTCYNLKLEGIISIA